MKEFAQSHLSPVTDLLYKIKYPSSRREYCPFCRRYEPMIPGGEPAPRKNALCSRCRSLERHRFLFYVYQVELLSSVRKLRVLHFAPELPLWKILSKAPNLEYVCGDLHPQRYREIPGCREINALDTKFQDGSFDAVIANHLIEHIPEDAFFRELYRILVPGGRAFLSTPVYQELEHTLENPEFSTPELRKANYGHPEHLRKYGRDIASRFPACFDVSVLTSDSLPPFGDRVNSNCFILRKKQASPHLSPVQ